MSTEAATLGPILNRLQERARRLEEEIAALRADVEQVARAYSPPVATYVVDGEEFIITEADVARVKSELLKPHSEEAIHVIALADKIGERQRHLPPKEQERLFWENVEAIRAQAITDGTAIDDPREATLGD
ncbi:MAG: hypothetical protein V3S14_11210 [Anaerolineae bacterium]